MIFLLFSSTKMQITKLLSLSGKTKQLTISKEACGVCAQRFRIFPETPTQPIQVKGYQHCHTLFFFPN